MPVRALGLLVTEGGMRRQSLRLFLDRNKPSYIGGILEHANHRLYRNWGSLTESLRSGEAVGAGKSGSFFAELCADSSRLEEFLRAMTGVQLGAFLALSTAFDLTPYKSVCDVGGAGGTLSIILAQAHPHLALTSFDLPQVLPISTRNVKQAGLAERVKTVSGDFFAGPLPKADLIEVGDGFDYTGADFAGWTKAAGFEKTTVMPLAGPTNAAIAYK